MRSFLVIALLIAAGYVSALEPPSPTPTKSATKQEANVAQNNRKPDANKRAPKDLPAIIEIFKTPVIQVETTDKTEKHRDYSDAEWWMVYLSGALALITISLAIYTARLWRETKTMVDSADTFSKDQLEKMQASIVEAVRAANAMENVAESVAKSAQSGAESVATTKMIVERQRSYAEMQLRAHVFVEFGNIGNVANPLPGLLNIPTPNPAAINFQNSGPFIYLQIKNFGHTPAYDVIHWGNAHFDRLPLVSPLPKRQRFPGMQMTKNMIGPGSGMTKNLPMPTPLTTQQIADLRAGTAAIYVYGIIVYKDTFGKRRRTRYRWMHLDAAGRIGVSTTLTGCGQGNEAT